MSMRKGIRKIVSLVTAGVMAASLFTVTGTPKTGYAEGTPDIDAASAVNYSTVLGRAVDFGITAAEMKQKGHMETPIAVKMFENNGSNNDVDLAGSDPVHFIIGGLKGDSKVILGKAYTAGMIYNVETTAEVKNKVEKHTNCDAEIKYNIASQDTINKNIDRVIGHITDESTTLAAKKGLDLSTVYTASNHVLDLTNSMYENKTVYIDLTGSDANTNDILDSITRADQLNIKKYSSTVVVFNMPAVNAYTWDGGVKTPKNIEITKYTVQVWDGSSLGDKITSGDQGNSGNDSPHNRDIDNEICQKVIWNMPTATDVYINNTAGTFLVPTTTAHVDVNTSAGWVATGGFLENSGEWHYIYHGRSKDVNEGEGIGQMHFAARKTFTDSYSTVKEDTTISAKEGEYKFNLYKTNSDYNIATGEVIGTAQNDAQSKIKFPTLSFNEAGTYYYVIKEQNPGVTKNGIKNSDGEIDIMLVVAIDADGNRTFTITSDQYLTAADKTAHKVFKNNPGIVMSGVEFSLGGYYNQIVKDIGTLKITKTVNGAPASASTKEYSYTISNTEGKYLNSDGTLSNSPVTLKIKGGETKVFEGLPFSTYTVTEDTDAAKITSYTLAATSITSGSAVIANPGDIKTVDLKNDYDQDKGQLEITKTLVQASDSKPAVTKEFYFAVKNSDGKYVSNTSGAIGTSTPVYLGPIKNGEKLLIDKLPVGTYTVEEQDARIADHTLTVTGLGDYTVTKGNKTDVAVNNAYETPKVASGNIRIVKQMTTDSDTIPAGKTFPISISFNTAGSYAVNETVVSFAANTAKTFYLGTTGSIEVSDIPAGVKYTISEVLTGAEYNGYTSENITNSTGTILDGVTADVKVTNKYVKPVEKGALSIVKAKATDSEVIPATKTFPVYVSFDKVGTYKVDGTDTAFTANGKVKYDLKIGDSVSITDIPVGVKYTVTEELTGTEYAGYTNVGITSTNSTNTIVKDQTDVVTVTNKYETVKGSIQITKTIEGPVTDAEARGALKFKITGHNTSYYKEIDLKDFTYSSGKYIYVLNNLKTDTYYVEETTKDVVGYENVSVKYSIGTNGEYIEGSKTTALSIDGNLQIVNFKDIYEKDEEAVDKGSIVIRKSFEGEALTTAQKENITFTIAKGSAVVKTVTYKDANLLGDITVTGLDVGEYTVTESQHTVTGLKTTTAYKVTVTGSDDVTGTGIAATVKVLKDDTSRVNFTNTYTKDESTTAATTAAEVTTAATTEATTTVSTEATTTTESISGVSGKTTSKKSTTESDDEDDGDGNLIITIYDEKTGGVVPGAKITVKNPSGKTTKYTTDDNGQVALKNVEAGEYTVTVTDVPEGYTVTENAEVSIQVVKNKTTKAQVKIDKDGEVSVTSKTTKSAAKTGDTMPVIPIATAFIIAILGLIILMFKRRQNA